ncbi:MAG: peptidoglycan-binding protein [Pseudomonadota bacterium]
MTVTIFRGWIFAIVALTVTMALSVPTVATAQVTAFKQAVAEAAARDADIAAFYQANGYNSIWTGKSGKERQRRVALFKALSQSGNHGLPTARYDAAGLQAKMKAAKTPRDRGQVEVELSRTFLQFARDLQTGVLVPSRVDRAIVRQVPYRDRTSYLVNFTKSSPSGFFKALAPKTTEYNALMKEKLRMERLLAKGGWGQTVPAKTLKPGQSGDAVAIMRNRLIAMGFLKRTNTQTYDANIQAAVQQFQLAHGLAADGVAGPGTMAEINRDVQYRLQSIIVAMERERWVNQERGKRHVLVNIPDFTAKVVDNGKVTFQTRSVVGANQDDRPTPFSGA